MQGSPTSIRRAPSRSLAWLSLLALGLVLARGVASEEHARAQPSLLAEAQAAYARGALTEAGQLFLSALRAAASSRAELAQIHLHLGIIAAARDAELTSRRHFELALALDPSLEAPLELGRRDRARFEQARPRRPLELRVEVTLEPSQDAAWVVASLHHAPDGAVSRIEMSCGEDRLRVEEHRRGSHIEGARAHLERSACDGGSAQLVVRALDPHGGEVARAEVRLPWANVR